MYQFSYDYSQSRTSLTYMCSLVTIHAQPKTIHVHWVTLHIGLYMYLKGDVVHWLFTSVDLQHTKTLIVKGVMQPQTVVSQ